MVIRGERKQGNHLFSTIKTIDWSNKCHVIRMAQWRSQLVSSPIAPSTTTTSWFKPYMLLDNFCVNILLPCWYHFFSFSFFFILAQWCKISKKWMILDRKSNKDVHYTCTVLTLRWSSCTSFSINFVKRVLEKFIVERTFLPSDETNCPIALAPPILFSWNCTSEMMMLSSRTEPHPMHTASPRAWSISMSLPPQFEQTWDILDKLISYLIRKIDRTISAAGTFSFWRPRKLRSQGLVGDILIKLWEGWVVGLQPRRNWGEWSKKRRPSRPVGPVRRNLYSRHLFYDKKYKIHWRLSLRPLFHDKLYLRSQLQPCERVWTAWLWLNKLKKKTLAIPTRKRPVWSKNLNHPDHYCE